MSSVTTVDHLAVGRLDEAERVDPAYTDSEPIRPMFRAFGVSIGHIRP